MSNYNNNYKQKRNSEKARRIIEKEAAANEHLKEIRNAINECANTIANNHGLSEDVVQSIIALIYEDKEAATELPLRIKFVTDILEKYGYTNEDTIEVINSNFSLIKQKPINLLHSLAIANQYGFDEDLLINNSSYLNINEKELYALIENLKSIGMDITPENIIKSSINVRSKGQMADLIETYPLERRKILVYRTLYDRNVKVKTLSRTK